MRPLVLVSLIALSSLASAQTPADYMRMRKSYGIAGPVAQSKLDELIGSKICELDGTVRGTFKIGYGSKMAELERPSGDTVVVEAESLPDWLAEGDVKVRLIVRATRAQEAAPLRLSLLSAATERDVLALAASMKPHERPAAKSRDRSLTSRRQSGREFTVPPNEVAPYYAGFILRRNPKLSRSEAYRIADGILGYSTRYGLDPRLIVAIIVCESDFDPGSTSNKGAMGLGQLMPDTAKWMGVDNAYDDLANIEGCIKLVYTHLCTYYRKTGDWSRSCELMLAAYNAGEGAVARHGGIPPYPETVRYVRKVIAEYNHLCGFN